MCHVSAPGFSFTQISPSERWADEPRAKDYPTTSVRGHRPLFRFTHVKTQCVVHLSVCLSIIIMIIVCCTPAHNTRRMYTDTHAHLRTVNTSFFFSSRFFSPQLLPSLYSVVVVFVQVTARPVVVLLIIYLFIVQTLRAPRPTRKVAAIHTTGKVSTTRHLYICVPYTHI